MNCPCVGKHCRLYATDPRHGTINGYTNLMCRCGRCRTANATYMVVWRRRNPHKTYRAGAAR